jgi:RNA polymerase sigma factor (TIGR02999 family)
MTMDSKTRVTAIVAELGGGETGASAPESTSTSASASTSASTSTSASVSASASAEELLPLVYEELRHRAALYMKGERVGHTLQPTALVHEAYMKLVDQTRVNWRGRTHFFAVAANAMRRLLIDHARGRARVKRGGGWQRVTLGESLPSSNKPDVDLEQVLSLSDALDELARVDEREAKVVELRFFAGLTMDEVARFLGVSKRTVEDDWTHARAWLARELSRRQNGHPKVARREKGRKSGERKES